MTQLISTDTIELAATVTTVYWFSQSLYGVWRSYQTWKDTGSNTKFTYLRQTALRKMRQQMFLCLWASIALISCLITLFLPIGELQSSIRNYALAILSLLGAYKTTVDYVEQRSTDISEWNGVDRRDHKNIE